MRCIDSYEHFSGFLPFLWLVHLLLLVSAYLLSPFRSLVTVVKFCFSIQDWFLRPQSFPRALPGALHASLRSSEAVFAFPSFIEEGLSRRGDRIQEQTDCLRLWLLGEYH